MTIANIFIFLGIVAFFLLEGFFEVALLSAIGAFTRRTFGTKQKNFKEYYSGNKIINSVLGFIVLIVILVIIIAAIKVFAA